MARYCCGPHCPRTSLFFSTFEEADVFFVISCWCLLKVEARLRMSGLLGLCLVQRKVLWDDDVR